MLVIIPAKKNSRRLKSKNKKFLGTMPLISWSINCAKKLTQNKNIIVSTNCKSIAKIAEKEKCKVPFFRPDNLTKDNTTMFEVVNHVVNEYEKKMKIKVKYILLLQPTTPFRKVKIIKKAIKKFKKNFRTLISVSKLHVKSDKLFKNGKNSLLKFSNQKKPVDILVPNGSFYLITKKNLLKYKNFYHDKMQYVLIDSHKENIDIDYKKDFELAKKFI